MKTAISIPDDIFNKADYVARKRGISRSQLYAEAIRAYIMDQQDPVTDALNRVYADQDSVDASVEGAALCDLPPDQW